MQKIITKNSDETQSFAQELSQDFKNGGIIALSGELGAGKTTFAQGFAKGLNIEDKIISPTFLIIRQYKIPDQSNFFYHIDLYRLENIDLKNSGLEEIISDPANVVLIEWPEKLAGQILPKLTTIKIEKTENDSRILKINN